jgi:pyruvate dehydrogenase E2 component (dihydrolipoyllysine-residue acetyltransferase)
VSTGTQVEVVMPQMGVSVSEGTITRWLKQPGETVTLDEPLLEISTDKVDTEVPSPGEGVLAEIRVQEGETVDVGSVLAIIAPEGAAGVEPEAPSAPDASAAAVHEPAPAEAPPAPPAPAVPAEPVATSAYEAPAAPEPPAAPAAEEQAPPVEDVGFHPAADVSPEPVVAQPSPAPAAVPEQSGNGRTFVSPVVARIAAEHGVDPHAVSGTGQGGRVTKKDILAFIDSGAPAPAAPTPEPATEVPAPAAPLSQPEPASAAPEAPAPVEPQEVTEPQEEPQAPAVPQEEPQAPAESQEEPTAPPAVPARPTPPSPVLPVARGPQPVEPPRATGEWEEPMNAMRRGIAEHMRRSLDTSAHVTSAIEVDMSRVVEARERLKREYQQTYGVNPTYLAFVTKAAVEMLQEWPWINGELRGEKIVTRSFVNVGIAVSLEEGKGLIVPVIRNAQDLNLLGIARAIADIAERARTKKLLPDDVQGGTFTITNPGGYGTFHGTPVISQPQAAILGTYALVKRPWVVPDARGQDVIAIRPMMNVTLTYDHRLVDGAYSGGFLRDLRARLENWEDES